MYTMEGGAGLNTGIVHVGCESLVRSWDCSSTGD